MKQSFRSILATARAGTMAVMMASSAMCQNSPAPVTNAQAQAFINHLQWKSPPYTQWDTNGNLTSVYLKSDEATDTNLALICTVESIKQLIMQTRSHGSNGLTAAGISCLGRLTNLTTLNVACTFKMPDGMFEEICKLQGLRSLGLVGAFPPERIGVRKSRMSDQSRGIKNHVLHQFRESGIGLVDESDSSKKTGAEFI